MPAAGPCRSDLSSLSDVRAAIDRIDDALVGLLEERFRAIKRAAELKSDAREALVEWRVEQVALRVRDAANRVGFDADVAERIWRGMMRECIDFERQAIRG